MRVLNVEYRVLAGFLYREVEVELKVSVGVALVEYESRCVYRDFVEQRRQRDCLSGALAELAGLAVADKHYHLHYNYVKALVVDTQRGKRDAHALNISVMVCAQDVYRLIVGSGDELVVVIRDIRHDVGREAVGAHQNEVLVAAEIGSLQPERAVLLVGVAALFQLLNNRLYSAVVVQSALLEPVVVLYAVLQQILLEALLVERQSIVYQSPAALFLGLRGKLLAAVEVVVILGVLDNIHAEVYVGGHCEREILLLLGDIAVFVRRGGLVIDGLGELLHVGAALRDDLLTCLAAKLEVTQVEGLAKLCDLVSGVVDVELTADLVASLLEQRRKAVADSAAAGVAYVHGSGWVRGNELYQHSLALAEVGLAVIPAERDSVLNNVCEPLAADEEIQKARSCDLDLAEIGAVQHSGFNYHLRDSAGITFKRLRGHQRGVRGEIAVAVVSRDSHLKRRQRLCGELSLADEPAERAHDYFLDLCLCFFYCVVHSVVLLLVVVGFYVYRYLIFEHKSRVDVYRIADVKLAAVGGHAVPHIYRGNSYHAVAVLRAVLAEMALSVLEHKARKRLAGAGHGDGVVLLAYAELHVASCVAGGFALVVVDEEAAAVLPEFSTREQLGAVRAAVRGLL